MPILTICGSLRHQSKTAEFVDILASSFPQMSFINASLADIPLFHPDAYDHILPKEVMEFKQQLQECTAVMIVTPEYIHNIPAVLKSALEWTTKSGEFSGKKTLAMTYTPHAPRGQKAMKSLLFSLGALEANVVASIDLYHDAAVGKELSTEAKGIMNEALKLL